MFPNNLNFTPPDLEDTRYLLAHEDAYDKYDMALVWMEDFLLHFTDRLTRARLSSEEANAKVKHLLLEPDLEPLSDHLLANHATALRLRAEAEQEAGIGRILADRFIDTLQSWQSHLSDAQFTQDLAHIARYYQDLESQPAPDPALAEVLFERARAYLQAENLAAAVADYQRAVQIKPDFVPAYLDLAQIAQSVGDWQTALNYYNRAIKLDPQNLQAYRLRGGLHSDLGNFEAAITDYNLVVAHEAQGNISQRRLPALELNPPKVEAYNNLITRLGL